jgi:hypothetical protein
MQIREGCSGCHSKYIAGVCCRVGETVGGHLLKTAPWEATLGLQ